MSQGGCMGTNETHQEAADCREELSASSEKGVVTAAPNPLSRRSFFRRVGASTALVAATSAALPSLLLSKTAQADDDDGDGGRFGIRAESGLMEFASERRSPNENIPTPRHYLERR